jgi:hypothetical protein
MVRGAHAVNVAARRAGKSVNVLGLGKVLHKLILVRPVHGRHLPILDFLPGLLYSGR